LIVAARPIAWRSNRVDELLGGFARGGEQR
jgi:hypothetical protein